jgi:hypothetical protein
MDLDDIVIDGLTIHIRGLYGADRLDATGLYAEPDGVKGLDGVAMRVEQIAIPGQRGSFALPGELESRTIAVSGTAVAPSPMALRALKEKFTGLLADGEQAPMVVTYTKGDAYRIMVQRLGAPLWVALGQQQFGQQAAASFQIQTFAADPLFFSSEPQRFGPVSSLVPVAVFHRGNVGSPANFTVTHQSGTIDQYALYNGATGQRYLVTKKLEPGHPQTIDMNTGDLIVDGAVVFGGRGDAVTWDIRPGAPQVHFIDTPNGVAQLACEVPDAIV